MPRGKETAAPAGTENFTLYVAIEISRKSWVVGLKSPVSERIGLHTIDAANVDALRDLIERHRARAERVLEREVRVLSCYEAGYEGFWLARWLDSAMALETVVLDAASLLVNRKAKQRKTDRIDAKKMVRALLAHDRGDAAVLSRVRVPTVEAGGPQALASGAPTPGEGTDIADELDQGASQVARHLRPAAPIEGLRGEVRQCEDRVRSAIPAAGTAGDFCGSRGGWPSWKSRSRRWRPRAMRWCGPAKRPRWRLRPRTANRGRRRRSRR